MARFERFIIYPLLILCLGYMFVHMTRISAQDGEAHFERIVVDKLKAGLISANDITVQEELLAMGSIVTLKEYVLLNKEGTRIVVLSVNAEDGGSLEVFNQTGRRAADFSTLNQSGLLMLYSNQGDTLLRLGQDIEGHGLIGVFDEQGDNPAFYGHTGRE